MHIADFTVFECPECNQKNWVRLGRDYDVDAFQCWSCQETTILPEAYEFYNDPEGESIHVQDGEEIPQF